MREFFMKTPRLALFLLFSPITPHASAGYGADNPRIERLYAGFISPCCWRENLTVHNSPVAGELRAEIVLLIQQGRSDDQIKSIFVEKYGKRILALPEGGLGLWLFWTPVLACAAGLAMVSLFVKRSRLANRAPLLAGLPPAELDENWDAR